MVTREELYKTIETHVRNFCNEYHVDPDFAVKRTQGILKVDLLPEDLPPIKARNDFNVFCQNMRRVANLTGQVYDSFEIEEHRILTISNQPLDKQRLKDSLQGVVVSEW